jgi:hypothetical protein
VDHGAETNESEFAAAGGHSWVSIVGSKVRVLFDIVVLDILRTSTRVNWSHKAARNSCKSQELAF